jgi:hypothetical protein
MMAERSKMFEVGEREENWRGKNLLYTWLGLFQPSMLFYEVTVQS